MFNLIIAIAISCGILGGIGGPVFALLISAYCQERRRIVEANPEQEQVIKLLPPSQPKLPQFNKVPPFDVDRIKCESKGVMIIGDMGSAKTCMAQYICQNFSDHGIIVFDPHDDDRTDWGNAARLTKMRDIYQQMQILLDSLDQKDKSKLLVVCDEWLEIRRDDLNKSGQFKGLAEKFIRLFSTKPRKFNKLAMFVLHSPNVDASGLDSFLRENYLKIHLGRLASKQFPQILPVAYPCIVEGEQFEHPTHGHHSNFAPKGKAPRGLHSVESARITIPIAGQSNAFSQFTVSGIKDQFEQLYQSEPGAPGRGTAELRNRPSEPPEPLQNMSYSDSSGSNESTYTRFNLTKQDALEFITKLKSKHNQTQIIEMLWNCTKGKSKAYEQARIQYREITGD